MAAESFGTDQPQYTDRLARLEGVWWKRALDVQRPYRWNLRRLRPGFTLDVGCGLGRNLINLGGAGAGVGVDHNPESVAACGRRGLTAFVPEAFWASPYGQPGRFDSLLLAHVVEHMRFDDAKSLLQQYLPVVRPGGQIILITPQEAGFASDPTHVEFMDLGALGQLAASVHLTSRRSFSFPLPRLAGRWFKYNEFVLVAGKP